MPPASVSTVGRTPTPPAAPDHPGDTNQHQWDADSLAMAVAAARRRQVTGLLRNDCTRSKQAPTFKVPAPRPLHDIRPLQGEQQQQGRAAFDCAGARDQQAAAQWQGPLQRMQGAVPIKLAQLHVEAPGHLLHSLPAALTAAKLAPRRRCSLGGSHTVLRCRLAALTAAQHAALAGLAARHLVVLVTLDGAGRLHLVPYTDQQGGLRMVGFLAAA